MRKTIFILVIILIFIAYAQEEIVPLPSCITIHDDQCQWDDVCIYGYGPCDNSCPDTNNDGLLECEYRAIDCPCEGSCGSPEGCIFNIEAGECLCNEEPFCGNNVKEIGEECDGTDRDDCEEHQDCVNCVCVDAGVVCEGQCILDIKGDKVTGFDLVDKACESAFSNWQTKLKNTPYCGEYECPTGLTDPCVEEANYNAKCIPKPQEDPKYCEKEITDQEIIKEATEALKEAAITFAVRSATAELNDIKNDFCPVNCDTHTFGNTNIKVTYHPENWIKKWKAVVILKYSIKCTKKTKPVKWDAHMEGAASYDCKYAK